VNVIKRERERRERERESARAHAYVIATTLTPVSLTLAVVALQGWMEEARLGVTALLDKISHIPTLKPAVTTLDQELDASILRAHDKAHEGHSHGSGHGHGHGHCSH
jgi:hypothetical protein